MKIKHLERFFFPRRLSLLGGILGLGLSLSAAGPGAARVQAAEAENARGPGVQLAIEGLNEILGRKGLRCDLLPFVFQQFLNAHYSIHGLNDEVRNRVADQFVKALDPSKSLLLESEANQLKREISLIFPDLRKGDCGILMKASERILERAREDVKIVAALVKPRSFQVDGKTELNLDPEKRGYPKAAADRESLIRKLVHFQMLNYSLTGVGTEAAKKQLIHRYELIVKRIQERQDRGELVTLFAESFAVALDPHSSYMSRENLEDFQIQMQLSLEGIGASLSSQDGFTVIEELIPGGSAQREGTLRPKDKIIAVGQGSEKSTPVIDMDLRDVVRRIRGPKGTKVRLTILRQSEKSETFDITLVRDKIDIKEQAAKLTIQERERDGKKFSIAVIDLPSFYGGGEKGGRSSYRDMKKLVIEAAEKKADAVVLNLSRNGGGLLDDAVKISGLFIQRGAIVATKSTDGQTDVLKDVDPETQFSGPVVVLTSRLSASASEILAGALRDYKRAVVVGGDHTYGKGTVQVLSGLPMGLGAMKVTTGMFFVPGGKSTQHIGVESDIQVPSPFNRDDLGEKTMDYSLPAQSIEKFLSSDSNASGLGRWTPVTPELIQALAARSKERVVSGNRFAEIKKETEEEKLNRGLVKLADLRKKAKKSDASKSSKKERDKRVKDLEQPLVDEGVDIAADWLARQGRG
jgi:carboxyl-terminal processing protease